MRRRYHFYVVRDDESGARWTLLRQRPWENDAKETGAHGTRKQVYEAGVAYARLLCNSGELAQVHMQEPDGKFRTEWTCADDAAEMPG